MPLPKEALTITGGCNCRNVVYQISIPSLEHRPIHPNYDKASDLSPVHLPYIFTDHCNDCRRASGCIIPAWVSGPLEYVLVSLVTPLPYTLGNDDSREWIPGDKIFIGKNELNEGSLSFYNSSPGRHRAFCTNCGTDLAYWEEQQPSMVDIVLGTVDREYLETENLRPERHLWWNIGIPWVKEYLEKGDGGQVEKHVDANMNQRFQIPKEMMVTEH